jgi:F-type H+-transporting ATPase subunit gamma
MSGLKEIRSRIASVKTTRQVTNAMKMVSAAKLKKAQDTVSSYMPYVSGLAGIVASLVSIEEERNTFFRFTQQRPPENILVVLITSNRGLCGSFNSKITSDTLHLIGSEYSGQLKDNHVHFLAIGKFGERLLKNHKMNVSGTFHGLIDHPVYREASEAANKIMESYLKNEYDRIILSYNGFVTASHYKQKTVIFLPMQISPDKKSTADNVIFEPSREEIAAKIIPMFLQSQFYEALLVSYAAEHGARMTAMHQATDNASELISELTLQYNKERQAAITKEILEITGGAEAQRKQ